jgi:hypothetical protein
LDPALTTPWIYNLAGDPGLLYRMEPDAAWENEAPQVAILNQAKDRWSAPAAFTLEADAFDVEDGVRTVVYYEGDTKVGEASEYPFAAPLTGVSAGLHAYRAVAIDGAGLSATSHVLQVLVTTENLPPAVRLADPAEGEAFPAPAQIRVEAQAEDLDGWIAQVDFYDGETWLGRSTAPPYALELAGVEAGVHRFRAVAMDNHASATSSAVAQVEVQAFRFVSVERRGDVLAVQWSGGRAPYRLEWRGALGPGADWQAMAARTYMTSATVPVEAAAGFLRVRSAE